MNKKYFLYYWLPPIVLILVIFFSSSQSYEQQDIRPHLNMHQVEQMFSGVRFYYEGTEVSVQSMGPSGFLEFFIRKAAHFGTNFLLGFLIYRALVYYTYFSIQKRVIGSILFIFGFASLDEIHQVFVSTRTPRLADVFVDSIGGLVGIVICMLIYIRIENLSKN
ncbi:VanZ family protein [Aneurinibacillus aneurinilyticus]|uniref:VanZ family protein n=1 Tax=Aneurinibacillus aneurinilyticus TaxID=1391 RepID=UPI0023F4B7B3|nr:VanZ family protein [Aneurinibacillus aneurinilyticus]